MKGLRNYLKCISSFPSLSSGLLYPIWGRSTIIEHLCRLAAIKGRDTLHILDQDRFEIIGKNIKGFHLGEEWSANFQFIFDAKSSIKQKIYRATIICKRRRDNDTFSSLIRKDGVLIYILQHNPPSQPTLSIHYCWQEGGERGIGNEFINENIWKQEEILFFAIYESNSSSFLIDDGETN